MPQPTLTHDETQELAFLATQGVGTWHFRQFRKAALVALQERGYVEVRQSARGNTEWALTAAGAEAVKGIGTKKPA